MTERTWRTSLRSLCGIASTLLALLTVVHLTIAGIRLVRGSVLKRARVVAEYREAGPIWHFRKTGEETQRLAAWLIENVPEDHALLFDGEKAGCLQLLAPLMFPRILVHARALAPGGSASGQPVFKGQPPWLEQQGHGIPVIVGSRSALRWTRR